MRFAFSDFNHCPVGRVAIQDIVWIMGRQMEALGHEVRGPTSADPWPVATAKFLDPPWVNVLLESFADDGTIPLIAAARDRGCRFLYVATELPTDRGFNGAYEPGMVRRQEAFPEAARCCDAILHLVSGDDVTRWYARFAPSAHAELGYAPGLQPLAADVEPDFDFGFFGQTTWRRREILDSLGTVGSTVVEDRLCLPRPERDALMRRARVILQIYRDPGWDYPSSTRCCAALAMGRPVIAEAHGRTDAWGEVVTFATGPDDFLRLAESARKNWRGLLDLQVERWRTLLPPTRCLEPALAAVGMADR